MGDRLDSRPHTHTCEEFVSLEVHSTTVVSLEVHSTTYVAPEADVNPLLMVWTLEEVAVKPFVIFTKKYKWFWKLPDAAVNPLLSVWKLQEVAVKRNYLARVWDKQLRSYFARVWSA